MRKPLETLGGLLVLGGVAGIVHWWLGWALFGIVARIALATPYLRDHEVVTYVALIAAGLAVLLATDELTESRDGEEPSGHDGG
jgi:hypothetical protein